MIIEEDQERRRAQQLLEHRKVIVLSLVGLLSHFPQRLLQWYNLNCAFKRLLTVKSEPLSLSTFYQSKVNDSRFQPFTKYGTKVQV